MSEWLVWVIIALVLLGIEILTLDLVFASLAVGAIAGAVTAAFNGPVVAQVLVGVIVALGTLFLLRPTVLRHLHGKDGSPTNVNKLTGHSAVVLERVDRREGRVKVGGEVWSARTSDSATAFDPGADVVVVSIEGATAVVDRRPD
jgi:membrane protein implicated in regulation of membrane protease activity